MQFKVEISGLDNVLATLNKLPKEVVSKRGGIVRQALFAGGRVLRKEASKNLLKATSSAGKMGISYGTGLTAKNIVMRRKNMPNNEKGERALLTVAYKPHPGYDSRFRNKPIKFNDIAFMLEYGSSDQPAEPWLRPAFHAKKDEAMKKMQEDLAKKIDKLAKQYLSKG